MSSVNARLSEVSLSVGSRAIEILGLVVRQKRTELLAHERAIWIRAYAKMAESSAGVIR